MWEDVEWTKLVQDKFQGPDLANTVMNFQFHQKDKEFHD
jgi:hypothetical protein